MMTFFAQWLATSISLWATSFIFEGIKFQSLGSLVVSALILGFANNLIKPLLITLTLPITFFTFGFFLLVINGAVLLIVSSLVRGFTISNLSTAILASIVISIISFLIKVAIIGDVIVSNTTNKNPWI